MFTQFHERLRAASSTMLWVGLLMVLLGFAAIIFPMISTLVATILVGWVFLVSGLITLYGSFSIHGTGPFFGALLLALLSVLGGVYMLVNPVAGEAALTLVAGALFMVQGAYEIIFAFEVRPLPVWGSMLISGIASAILSVVIVAGWPGISLIALGILLGVNFLSTGFAFIFLSRALKPASAAHVTA